MKNHKIKCSIDKTKNAIDEMRIHQKIHNDRIMYYEQKIVDLFNQESNNERKNRLMNDYRKIVERNDQNCLKKLRNKFSFFDSEKHMITISENSENNNTENYIINQNETDKSQCHEDTDIDDTEMDSTQKSNTKRKAPTSIDERMYEI